MLALLTEGLQAFMFLMVSNKTGSSRRRETVVGLPDSLMPASSLSSLKSDMRCLLPLEWKGVEPAQ